MASSSLDLLILLPYRPNAEITGKCLCLVYLVLGVKCRASYMLGKHSPK